MIWPDIAILVIVVVSALIGILRGFVREALTLIALIVASWVAFTFNDNLALWMTGKISLPVVNNEQLAFVILFMATYLFIEIINYFIGKIAKATGLKKTDRFLGMLFGVVRGAVIVAIIVFLFAQSTITEDPLWQESLFIKHIDSANVWVLDYFGQILPNISTMLEVPE